MRSLRGILMVNFLYISLLRVVWVCKLVELLILCVPSFGIEDRMLDIIAFALYFIFSFGLRVFLSLDEILQLSFLSFNLVLLVITRATSWAVVYSLNKSFNYFLVLFLILFLILLLLKSLRTGMSCLTLVILCCVLLLCWARLFTGIRSFMVQFWIHKIIDLFLKLNSLQSFIVAHTSILSQFCISFWIIGSNTSNSLIAVVLK